MSAVDSASPLPASHPTDVLLVKLDARLGAERGEKDGPLYGREIG